MQPLLNTYQEGRGGYMDRGENKEKKDVSDLDKFVPQITECREIS